MPYCKDIERFPGGINLFNVNNKHTRAKFCNLGQSFSQRCVYVFQIQKNISLFSLNNKFLLIFVKIRDEYL